MTEQRRLYPEPVKGIRILEPLVPPTTDEVLLGYEIDEIVPEDTCNCFVEPRPRRMTASGWMNVILTVIVFWPLSCLPCCMKSSYDTVQRPVYGPKSESREKELVAESDDESAGSGDDDVENDE